MNQDDECDFNDGNRDEEHEDDTEDNFDEEAILNIPDSKQYLHVKNNLHVSKIKRITKSSSYASKNYYCGFCYKRIETPIFMYSDKVFCTSICRNNQFHQDSQQLNVDTRMNHSRSM